MLVFRSFPQENEKNNSARLIGVKLISVALEFLKYQTGSVADKL
jgi:hypothetical protein